MPHKLAAAFVLLLSLASCRSDGAWPTVEPLRVEVLALKFAPADELCNLLQEIYPMPKARLLVDGRTNSLIVSADESTLEEIRTLVASLDVEARATQR